jgi:hypothetical protein
MNRVLVSYGGREYAIGNRSRADIETEIGEKLDSGRVAWLDVADGEGKPTPARLLLTPGVAIALVELEKPDAVAQGSAPAP